MLKQTIRAPVHIIAAEQMLARPQQLENVVRRGAAARVSEAKTTGFEGGNARLQGGPRWVATAGILKGSGPARRQLREGRRKHNRRHDCAEQRVGSLPGMNRR